MRQRLGFRHEDVDPRLNELAGVLVEAAVEVRKELGAGLLESVYLECLAAELRGRGYDVDVEVPIPVTYKGQVLDKRFRVDLLIQGAVVVEVKAAEAIQPVHVAQTLTYLRLSGKPLGFLINFHAVPFRDGIRRFANTQDKA